MSDSGPVGAIPVGGTLRCDVGRQASPATWRHALLAMCVVFLVAVATARAEAGASTEKSPVSIEVVEKPELPLRYFVARVSLADPRVRVRCVPAGDDKVTDSLVRWPTKLQTVRHAADREGFALAVNGDYFSAERTVDAEGKAARTQYVVGKAAVPAGNCVSDGVRWSKAGKVVAMLVVAKDGSAGLMAGRDVPDNAQEVVSGNPMLLRDGSVAVEWRTGDVRAPRTLVGISSDGKTLLLIVVDGRSIRSRGSTHAESAEIARSAGCATAINLDGGGSSTMVARGALAPGAIGSDLTLVNSPSDGSERPVANVLGIVVTN